MVLLFCLQNLKFIFLCFKILRNLIGQIMNTKMNKEDIIFFRTTEQNSRKFLFLCPKKTKKIIFIPYHLYRKFSNLFHLFLFYVYIFKYCLIIYSYYSLIFIYTINVSKKKKNNEEI